jgi:biopolymer transport protein ExbD
LRFKTKLAPSFSLIDLTPLVDVIFLLLIFFVVTSEVLPLKSLPINHPKLSHASTALTSQLVIVVDRYQVIYVGSKKTIVDIRSLKAKIAEELPKDGRPLTLVLSMDQSIRYEMFLKIFNEISSFKYPIRLVYEQV